MTPNTQFKKKSKIKNIILYFYLPVTQVTEIADDAIALIDEIVLYVFVFLIFVYKTLITMKMTNCSTFELIQRLSFQ